MEKEFERDGAGKKEREIGKEREREREREKVCETQKHLGMV